jgi:L-ascorbate metabolism protein UlaG (beta-lactamase superfamily)
MEIVYHGHSCVQLILANGKSIVIDPFLSGNPLAVTKPADIRADYILLTHAHSDHIADAETIAKANDATVVAIFELATYLSWKQVKTIGVNMGGWVDLGCARVKLVQAFHSSGFIPEDGTIIYGGMPGGFIIEADGLTLLHAGDTALFSDMRMIGERHKIDVAFLPIGDHFTMGPDDALQAAEWYNAKLVIPVHYNTFPPIRQDAAAFVQRLEAQGRQGRALAPGERMDIRAE